MIRIVLFALTVCIIPPAVIAFAEDPGQYCDDQTLWQHWADLVEEFPDDDDLAIGYALRIGLCEQLEAGTIEQDRAIDLFDRYLNALKAATGERERQALKDDQLKNGGI